MIRVGILDDHALVREGIKRVIQQETDIAVVWEGECAKDAAVIGGSSGIDILILDLNLPDRDGIEVLKDLRVRAPELPVFILSMNAEKQYAQRVIRAGANGYLVKDKSTQYLVQGIRAIVSGGVFLTDSTVRQLVAENTREQNRGRDSLHHLLSDREFELFLHLARGIRLKDAAARMGVSTSTANTYRRRILDKMSMQTTGDIIRYALRFHLVDGL